VLVPYREQRLFVGAALGLGEKSGKFVVAGQVKLLYMMSGEYYQITVFRVWSGNSGLALGVDQNASSLYLVRFFIIAC